MSERFVSEPIEPVVETSDTTRMSLGEPGLPRLFIWRDRVVEVSAVLRAWHDTGPCRHGSDEMYVRKHWYKLATRDHGLCKIYFERHPRRGSKGPRWWLFSIDDSGQPSSLRRP